MDLTTLTAEELDDHYSAVLAERQRRAELDEIPTRILEDARKYVAGGGDPTRLPNIPESVA